MATARPCVSRPEAAREEQVGMVRVRVESWETPWARRAANACFGCIRDTIWIVRWSPGLELEREADCFALRSELRLGELWKSPMAGLSSRPPQCNPWIPPLLLMPDFALILLGAALRRWMRLKGDHFWSGSRNSSISSSSPPF